MTLVARGTINEADLPRVVGFAGGSWKPSGEVVFDALDGLVKQGCIRPGEEGALRITPRAYGLMLQLLEGYRPGFLGEADLIVCSTVLPMLRPEDRRTVSALLDAHWRAEHAWWETATRQCPCEVPSVRRLFERRLAEAALELAHLDETSVAGLG